MGLTPFDHVESRVFCLTREHGKILHPIVPFISVNVVNNFSGKKLSSKLFLRYCSMDMPPVLFLISLSGSCSFPSHRQFLFYFLCHSSRIELTIHLLHVAGPRTEVLF